MSFALDALIVLTGWTHVLLAPYTKVEESFNLHAVHDSLLHGVVNLDNYDHFTFPGVVPRTFIGSVLLAWISNPVIQAATSVGLVTDKFDLQIIVRLVLSTLNAFGLCFLRRAVSRRFGRPTSLLFTIITTTQFHIPFWMGRTLPNMFAMLPVNVASALLLSRHPSSTKPSPRSIYTAIILLTSTAVVFRAEIALLLAPLVLQALVLRYISFVQVVKVGMVSGLASIALTTAVDSYFWRTLVWPEFAGIYFNVVEGKSSEWGTSPPLTYFISSLPKLLLTAFPLSILGFFMDSRIREALTPHIAFVALISLLAHKEWRFIIYVVPVFNIAAARAGRWMLSQRKSTFLGRLLFLVFWSMILVNTGATIMGTITSMANYPGGEALMRFTESYSSSKGVPVHISSPLHVHISNLAAQTGASLFLQVHAPPFASRSTFCPHPSPGSPANCFTPVYDKTENMTLEELTGSHEVTHLISEWSPLEMNSRMRVWRLLSGDGDSFDDTQGADAQSNVNGAGVITAYAGLQVNRDALNALKGLRFGEAGKLLSEKGLVWMRKKPVLWIYGRR
ncbi:alpha-1,6-mannosyltransferase subunit [Gymnopus androsaceus JB14]|uniref:Mannosyltransferase n=1 Tax=Gymnopus androsaceus JB14 TaxID=1447944 RepID=A0A6A4HRC4_9AGAR|nr:alpha-1,6-mannosyltransferase subunit [Gymnopus androsaceus JB14]